jgi:hypothetical protein
MTASIKSHRFVEFSANQRERPRDQMTIRQTGCTLAQAAVEPLLRPVDDRAAAGQATEQRRRCSIDVAHGSEVDDEVRLRRRERRRTGMLQASYIHRTQPPRDDDTRSRV